ncbi:MAG: DegV family protein [Dehalococcoidia bacterium]|nr:DegV family protein [Dehalococcoidia bacterium]
MEKIAIVTDSTACLTREMVEQYGIRLVSANILFDGKVYREYVDISPSEAYQLLERDPERFTTSAASPADYLEAFRELSTRAESILCITISSKLSAFYDMAQAAKEQVKEELSQTQIELLDSLSVAAAEGFVVLAAARAVADGKSLAEAIKAAEAVKEKATWFAIMETIRHAYRTGRIPKVAAQIGSALSIKPILGFSDGAVSFVGIARTKERGVNRILQMTREKVGENPVHMAVMHADALEEAQRLKERVASQFNCVELWLSEFSPIMGYATGRGLVGLAFYAEG